MFQLMKIERSLHKCPEIDFDEEEWPLISDDELRAMEEKCRGHYRDDAYIFPLFRKREDGLDYIDLYFWCSGNRFQKYQRFIIVEGYRFTEEKEMLFLNILHEKHPFIDRFEVFCSKVNKMYPEWHLSYYSQDRFYKRQEDEFSQAMEHLYYASHRSGAKELLYKSGFTFIAWNLHRIPSLNLAGTTPESIHGMPKKLLRIMDNPQLVGFLFEEESIELSRRSYLKFSGYIGKKQPNSIQWEYLCSISKDSKAYKFKRSTYEGISVLNSEIYWERYAEFFRLKDELKDIINIETPKPVDLRAALRTMRNLKDVKNDNIYYVRDYEKRRKLYEYSSDDYIVVMPRNGVDIVKEGYFQHNCLSTYVEDVLYGRTEVLFIRKKEEPDKSFVTMEINEGKITEVRGSCNNYPCADIYRFLEKYSLDVGCKYVPEELVEDYNCPQELFQYFQERRAAKNPFLWVHEKVYYYREQVNIWDFIEDDQSHEFPDDLF